MVATVDFLGDLLDSGTTVNQIIHTVVLPPVPSRCKWVGCCNIITTLHYILVRQEVSEGLVVCTTCDLEVTGTFVGGPVAWLCISQVRSVLVVPS